MPSLRVVIFIYFVSCLLFLVSFATPAYAQTREECGKQQIGTIGCLPYYLNNIVNGALGLAGVVAVILITVSGIRLLLSGGDVIKVEKAKKSLTYSIIGFVIILASFFLLNAVSLVTGAKCISTVVYDNCNK